MTKQMNERLDETINRLIEELRNTEDSERIEILTSHITDLVKVRNEIAKSNEIEANIVERQREQDFKQAQAKAKPKIDPNVLISAGSSFALGLLILNYEKLGIITSKAMSLVKRHG